MKGKKILIIGGAGFLGQTMMKPLFDKGVPFFYADLKPIVGMEENFIPLNVLEASSFKDIDKDFTAIINLTGQVTNPSNLCLKLNTKGIHNIINFAKENHINLIQVSTISVYGSSDEVINEDSKLNPETTYGSCKAMAEYLIQNELSDNQYSIIRLSNLYGRKQSKGVLAYLLRCMEKNENVFFNNDGTLKRHFLNVEDAANIIAQMSCNFRSGIYNYPGNDVFSIKELISLLEQIGNKTLNTSYENNKPWENLPKIDSSKINITFVYSSQHTLKGWLTKQLQTK